MSRVLEAALFDVDGVLTRTARLHERAWKAMFDDYLRRLDQPPFTGADYRVHVDGKPRYQGVADFLGSRGIELERGDPGDDPDRETACGLGNRKNRLFLRLLDEGGVEVFDDSIAALARWRRGGVRVAAISASRNSRRVLEAADLARRFDVIIDGQIASRRGLESKREILSEAARRLDVPPASAVVIEDAIAGIRAGLEAGFGLVVGVARDGDGRDLREAGAHQVVDDVYRARFLRRLPAALERVDELAAWRGGRPLAVFGDDGARLRSEALDESFVIYIGNDEEAFAALRERGAGIFVGPAVSASLADYRVGSATEARRLLELLANRAGP